MRTHQQLGSTAATWVLRTSPINPFSPPPALSLGAQRAKNASNRPRIHPPTEKGLLFFPPRPSAVGAPLPPSYPVRRQRPALPRIHGGFLCRCGPAALLPGATDRGRREEGRGEVLANPTAHPWPRRRRPVTTRLRPRGPAMTTRPGKYRTIA
jgi:hypothetical protein